LVAEMASAGAVMPLMLVRRVVMASPLTSVADLTPPRNAPGRIKSQGQCRVANLSAHAL
jgi:hypothetical protein